MRTMSGEESALCFLKGGLQQGAAAAYICADTPHTSSVDAPQLCVLYVGRGPAGAAKCTRSHPVSAVICESVHLFILGCVRAHEHRWLWSLEVSQEVVSHQCTRACTLPHCYCFV